MSDFLYPFLSGEEVDGVTLLDDLAVSARAKVATSTELRDRTLEALRPDIERAAALVGERLVAGGTL
ncbi:MAG: hypothetical protein OSA99_20895, partial [Acidimicrobiales bacterium]|nr:hypothetical protein [Acidimicrobiales bacterium]